LREAVLGSGCVTNGGAKHARTGQFNAREGKNPLVPGLRLEYI
jgi:hypothetical protein